MTARPRSFGSPQDCIAFLMTQPYITPEQVTEAVDYAVKHSRWTDPLDWMEIRYNSSTGRFDVSFTR